MLREGMVGLISQIMELSGEGGSLKEGRTLIRRSRAGLCRVEGGPVAYKKDSASWPLGKVSILTKGRKG